MQPQMPYGAPQGPQPNPGPTPPQGYQGYPNPQAPQPNFPYQNQGQNQGQPPQYPSGSIPGTQPPYNQSPMPQYQPPAGYRPQLNHPKPLPPPPPVQKTPYDFFMSQKHPTNTKLPIPGPRRAGFRGKLVWISGAAAVVVIVVVLISALSPKDTSGQALVTIAQNQQEIARVCGLGSKAKTSPRLAFSVNCTTTILSDQKKLLNYMSTQGIKIKSKQLGTLTNSATDKSLAAATASSNYDEVFKTVSAKQMAIYINTLQQQLSSNQFGPTAQELLTAQLAHAKILASSNQ